MAGDLDPPAHLWAFNLSTASERLNIPVTSLRAAIRNGTVRAARIGQRYYITAAEIERLLTPTNAPTERQTSAS
jgi:excisionase family DNA binding protein